MEGSNADAMETSETVTQGSLFAGFKKRRTILPSTSEEQLQTYLMNNQDTEDPIIFWSQNTATYPTLSKFALETLAVPATSAAVERVFSQGSIFLRPHRAGMSANTLKSLVLLKCNYKIQS